MVAIRSRWGCESGAPARGRSLPLGCRLCARASAGLGPQSTQALLIARTSTARRRRPSSGAEGEELPRDPKVQAVEWGFSSRLSSRKVCALRNITSKPALTFRLCSPFVNVDGFVVVLGGGVFFLCGDSILLFGADGICVRSSGSLPMLW